MKTLEDYRTIFDYFGGLMTTADLNKHNIGYRQIQRLIEDGSVEKIRHGYYQWVDPENYNEMYLVQRLFPDAIFCMDTVLQIYQYSDRNPLSWHIAVNRYSTRSRFDIPYPLIQPYYVEPHILKVGMIKTEIDGRIVKMYDRDRTIVDCVRNRRKMDKETYTKAVTAYLNDKNRNIANLLDYADQLHIKHTVIDLIGVWL